MKSYSILFLLFGTVFAVSLYLSYFLYQRSVRYYHEVNALRLDPLGLNVYQTDTNIKKRDDISSIVIVGDSRAAYWMPVDTEDFHFINRGIGGQTSAQVYGRFKQHIEVLHPDVIVLQVGINDLKTIPLFPDQKKRIIENTKKNIQHIVDASKRIGAITIVSTLFPLGEVPLERKLFWSKDVNIALKEVNHFIYSLQEESVIMFDTYSILNANAQASDYTKDLLHLNKKGYGIINDELLIILRKLKDKEVI